MSQLSESRTLVSTAEQHLSDHNELHRLHNILEEVDLGTTELAYAENQTGVSVLTSSTSLSPTDVTGLLIVVPASTRPVWLETFFLYTVPAAFNVYGEISEVSNGIDTPKVFPGFTIGIAANCSGVMRIVARLGPTLRPRTFKTVWQKQGTGQASAFTNHPCFLAAHVR